jgi:hypothetical protein
MWSRSVCTCGHITCVCVWSRSVCTCGHVACVCVCTCGHVARSTASHQRWRPGGEQQPQHPPTTHTTPGWSSILAAAAAAGDEQQAQQPTHTATTTHTTPGWGLLEAAETRPYRTWEASSSISSVVSRPRPLAITASHLQNGPLSLSHPSFPSSSCRRLPPAEPTDFSLTPPPLSTHPIHPPSPFSLPSLPASPDTPFTQEARVRAHTGSGRQRRRSRQPAAGRTTPVRLGRRRGDRRRRRRRRRPGEWDWKGPEWM